MKRTISVFVQIATVFAVVLLTSSMAQAATRTWVSGANGNDANPCTRTMPCATFQQAITVTDAGGEINCIDGGSFGNLEITHSVTISCDTGTAGLTSTFFDTIILQTAATDVVILRGLDFNGSFAASTGTAIVLNGLGGTVHIEKCVIHGFTNAAIILQQSGKTSLSVTDTTLADNGTSPGGANIVISPPTGAPLVSVSLKNVRMLGGGGGLNITDNTATTIHAVVQDSLADGSSGDGILASTTGGRVTMLVDHTTASNNGLNGIEAIGANAEVDIGNSRIYGNTSSTAISGGGPTLLSFGNNEIVGNGHNAAIATTSTE